MLSFGMDWLELVVRWIHVITGVSWIGASFYFNWLNNNIRPPESPKQGVDGEVWAVHGGHFYNVSKYEVAPEQLPKTLHWFKYEAYFTWISGFTLLAIVYYYGASLYLIDPLVAELTPLQATGIGVATLVSGWFVYDLLCKSPLSSQPVAFAGVGFSLLTGVAYFLCSVFSSRGAYIHMGALIGTMMAANVFFVIIPNQRVMVDQMTRKEEPDPKMGRDASLRSLHNNYLTLPVLFIMVSNHYPMTYGHEWNWAILAAISLIGAGVRHWFNLRGKGHQNVWILPVAAASMLALAFVTSPRQNVAVAPAGNETVSFADVQVIIGARCQPCHAANPTHPAFPEAPLGFMLDTPEQIKAKVDLIKVQAIETQIMPLGNLTQMTPEERGILARWIEQGANIEQ